MPGRPGAGHGIPCLTRVRGWKAGEQLRDAYTQSAAGSSARGLQRISAPATRLVQQAWRGLPLPASARGACQGAPQFRLFFSCTIMSKRCCTVLSWAACLSPCLKSLRSALHGSGLPCVLQFTCASAQPGKAGCLGVKGLVQRRRGRCSSSHPPSTRPSLLRPGCQASRGARSRRLLFFLRVKQRTAPGVETATGKDFCGLPSLQGHWAASPYPTVAFCLLFEAVMRLLQAGSSVAWRCAPPMLTVTILLHSCTGGAQRPRRRGVTR